VRDLLREHSVSADALRTVWDAIVHGDQALANRFDGLRA
jgi:hypothetical protein